MTPRRRVFAVVIAVLSALALISPANAAGGTWTRQTTVNPTAVEVWLTSVSCVSASSCEGVGYIATTSGRVVPLAEHWNGTKWGRQAPAPVPGSTGVNWSGVSCVGEASCEAVGSYSTSSGNVPVVERWNGTKWVRQGFPRLSAPIAWLNAVSCVNKNACEAVGESFVPDSGSVQAFGARWNGTKWVHQALAGPAGSTQVAVGAISCARAAACEAVGSYDDSSGHMLSLAERWNGTKWVHQQTVDVAKSGILTGVSCLPGWCEAVGAYTNASIRQPLAERWNGIKWVRQAAPSPAGFGQLTSVSCVSRTNCEAVGNFTKGVFAEHGNGSAWVRQAVPNPTHNGAFTGVSCVTGTTCEAVGDYFNGSQEPRSMAERYRS